MAPVITIGVLALQGAFSEHINVLSRISGVEAIEVRTKEDLDKSQALILPGGESTAIIKSASRNDLIGPLREFIASKPVWGTCAGMILLCNEASNTKQGGQELLGGLDVLVKRNAFGHQVDSFCGDIHVDFLNDNFPGVFIRAPIVEKIGKGVEVICKIDAHGMKDVIVAVRQNNILATSFHPELTADDRFHRYFISMINKTA